MLVADFDFRLPEDLIAQQPPAVRGSSRMLRLHRATGDFEDRAFTDLPSLLQPGDLLILNDSRVLPARLFATRAGLATQHNSPSPTGQVEVLLTQPMASAEGHNDWAALVRPAKKVQVGETLLFAQPECSGARVQGREDAKPSEPLALGRGPLLTATVIATGCFGERTLRFSPVKDFHGTLERIGHLPLPPYIYRDKSAPNTAEDRERYQTVYSRERGSAAAPTAGLHFTPEVLEALAARGVEVRYITLHVGLGTFQPVRADRTEDIRLHAERYSLPPETASAILRAQVEERRIIAAGTTTTRTLEHIALEAERSGQPIAAHSGETSIFIGPGHGFRIVDGLLTNFHLPQSTLLMLVSALAGREAVLRAYAHAVAQRYRFFSYGDCMLIL